MSERGTGGGCGQAGTHVGRGQHSQTFEFLILRSLNPHWGSSAHEANPNLAHLELGLKWKLRWGRLALDPSGRMAEASLRLQSRLCS